MYIHFWCIPRTEITGRRVCKLPASAVFQNRTSTHSQQQCEEIVCSQLHQHFLSFLYYYFSHYGRYGVVWHCDFNLHFFDDKWNWMLFQMYIGHLDILLFIPYSRRLLTSLLGCLVFLVDLYELLIYSGNKSFVGYTYYKCLLPLYGLSYHFLSNIFWWKEVLNVKLSVCPNYQFDTLIVNIFCVLCRTFVPNPWYL